MEIQDLLFDARNLMKDIHVIAEKLGKEVPLPTGQISLQYNYVYKDDRVIIKFNNASGEYLVQTVDAESESNCTIVFRYRQHYGKLELYQRGRWEHYLTNVLRPRAERLKRTPKPQHYPHPKRR